MKNTRIALWLALAFLAGGATSWVLSVPSAWAQQRTAWDYYCFDARKEGIGHVNTQGRVGWELVTADGGWYCMKRPKQ